MYHCTASFLTLVIDLHNDACRRARTSLADGLIFRASEAPYTLAVPTSCVYGISFSELGGLGTKCK